MIQQCILIFYSPIMALIIASQDSPEEILREVQPTFFFGVPRYTLSFHLACACTKGLSNQSACLSDQFDCQSSEKF